MNISEYISQLLYRYDCVVVPGLGGFVANYSAAHYDEEKKIFHAPGKRLIFNPRLTQNDGLLVNELVKHTALTYTEAQETLTQLVAELKNKLNTKKYAELGTAGVLMVNNDGEINFRQGGENFLLTSFGFRPVIAIPVEQPLKASPLERKSLEEKRPLAFVPDSRVPRKTSWKKVAIATLLVPVAFYGFWIPLKTDLLNGGELSYTDLNPFKIAVVSSYAERTVDISAVDFEEVSEDEVISQKPDEVSEDLPEESTERIAPLSVSSHTGNYVLIGGCFGEEANAHKFVNSITSKGYQPFILDVHKGLHRVVITTYASHDEAVKAQKSLKESGVSTWVLKK
ncbi:MAG: SPOR domain-containing protein [Flavobacteriales bacterium]